MTKAEFAMQLAEVERLVGQGRTATEIAASIGKSYAHAVTLVGRVRQHLGMPPLPRSKPPISKPKPIPAAQLAEIKFLMLEGVSGHKISKAIGIGENRVLRAMTVLRREAGLPEPKPAPYRFLTAPQVREIQTRIVGGVPTRQIAADMGLALSAIRRVAGWLKQAHPAAPRCRGHRELPLATIRYIEAEVAAGRSARLIALGIGIPVLAAKRVARRWRVRNGYADQFAHKASRGPGVAARAARAADLCAQGLSTAQLAAELGVSQTTAWKYRKTYLAGAGKGSLCGCGRADGHRGSCVHLTTLRRVLGADEQVTLERLTRAGAGLDVIARTMSIPAGTINDLRAPILAALRAQGVKCPCGRQLAHAGDCAKRPHLGKPATGPAQPSYPDLMRRADRHVPRSLDASLRDDILAEICLAVIEGRVEAEQIGVAAKGFISRGFAQWADKFGARSLDAPLSNEDGRTLADTIGDGTGADLLTDLSIGGGR